MSQGDYLHLLGGLNYLTKSRPEIGTACSIAATHSASPTRGAFTELLYIVKYLNGTKTKGLILYPGNPSMPLQLTCYVDASYLTHADSKSHTGFCMSFGRVGSFFYSKSSKQTSVATSSTHAEMRALYSVIIDTLFLITLCDDLQRPLNLPCIIYEDNQPVLDLTVDVSARAKKCKHFLMLIAFIREQVDRGLIEIRKISSEDNVADILTKIVVGSAFTRKASRLLGEALS
jgi:hypothetical protein